MSGDPALLDAPADRSSPGVLTSVRSHVVAILCSLVAGAVIGYVGTLAFPARYTAQAAIYLSAQAPFSPTETEAETDPTRFAADQAELVLTSAVLQRAGESVVPPVPLEELRGGVSAEPSLDTSSIAVSVERPDAEQSRALADAVVDAYRQAAAARVAELVSAATRGADPAQVREVGIRAAAYGDGVAAVENAELPDATSSPSPAQNALLVGLLGFGLAVCVAIAGDLRRVRTASVADLDFLLGAPLLARFRPPPSARLVDMITRSPPPDVQQAVDDVLASIDTALEDEPNPSVLFLSWQRALTTTSLVASTAYAAARAGRSVVVVDGGLKGHGISTLTDVDPGAGLEALADPEVPVHGSMRTWRIAGPGGGSAEVGVVPLAGWAPTLTNATARPGVLRAAVARLQPLTSLILVDGPPLTERSLGLALGRGVGHVVLVVDAETSIEDAREMGRRIALAGVGVRGYVLVGGAGGLARMTSPQQRLEEGPVSLGAAATARRR